MDLSRGTLFTIVTSVIFVALVTSPGNAAYDVVTVNLPIHIPPYIEIESVGDPQLSIPGPWTYTERYLDDSPGDVLKDVLYSQILRVPYHLRVVSNLPSWHITASVKDWDEFTMNGGRIGVKLDRGPGDTTSGFTLLTSSAKPLYNTNRTGVGTTVLGASYQAVVPLEAPMARPPEGFVTVVYTVTGD